jgi:hypothetical protein
MRRREVLHLRRDGVSTLRGVLLSEWSVLVLVPVVWLLLLLLLVPGRFELFRFPTAWLIGVPINVGRHLHHWIWWPHVHRTSHGRMHWVRDEPVGHRWIHVVDARHVRREWRRATQLIGREVGTHHGHHGRVEVGMRGLVGRSLIGGIGCGGGVFNIQSWRRRAECWGRVLVS